MRPMVSEERFQEIAFHCEDMDLDAVWYCVHQDFHVFEEAREAFFTVLRRLLEERHVRLQDFQTHQPLPGTIDEQIDQFRKVFPKNDAEMENGLWFFDPQCPGGCNWKWQR